MAETAVRHGTTHWHPEVINLVLRMPLLVHTLPINRGLENDLALTLTPLLNASPVCAYVYHYCLVDMAGC